MVHWIVSDNTNFLLFSFGKCSTTTPTTTHTTTHTTTTINNKDDTK